MLYERLIAPFILYSRRNTTIDDRCSAVAAVLVDPLIRCSSGSAIDSSVFGLSSLVFLGHLFNRYRPCFAYVAQQHRRVCHGRRRAWFEPLLIQLMPPMGAPCRGDHAGTSVVAEDLVGGEKSPVKGPRRRGQRGLTGGVTLSVAV